jgi:hypothetical protein
LINDDFARLINRNVDNLGIRRSDLDDTVGIGHDQLVVGLEVTGRIRQASQVLGSGQDSGAIRQHGFAQCPGPVEILVHHQKDLGVIQ